MLKTHSTHFPYDRSVREICTLNQSLQDVLDRMEVNNMKPNSGKMEILLVGNFRIGK